MTHDPMRAALEKARDFVNKNMFTHGTGNSAMLLAEIDAALSAPATTARDVVITDEVAEAAIKECEKCLATNTLWIFNVRPRVKAAIIAALKSSRSNRGQDTVQVTIPGVPPGADTI